MLQCEFNFVNVNFNLVKQKQINKEGIQNHLYLSEVICFYFDARLNYNRISY